MPTTVLQPSTLQTLETSRLFLNIEQALGTTPHPVSTERHAGTADVPADEYFRIVRLVLTHLLGEDTGFANGNPALPDAAQANRLMQLYQGEKAWKLCADAVGVPLSEVTPWLVHQFFARMAWLNEARFSTPAQRSQLHDLIYELRYYQSPDEVVDMRENPLFAELLGSVPEDLRLWMVQFKRGERLMPMGELIARSDGRALCSGLLAWSQQDSRSALSVFSDVMAAKVAPGDYCDKTVSSALEQQLKTLATWASMVAYLQAIPESDHPDSRLQLDVLTPTSVDSRSELLRKVATYVLNPTDDDWLALAIAGARQAPGMQLLSLAIELRSRHADLALEPAMSLAAILLRPVLHVGPSLDEALPTARFLNVTVPALNSWCEVHSANELFRQMGIELLCRADGAQALRWSPAQCWHALSQTRAFTTLFAPLLARLNWYAGSPQQQASPRITQALAGRAIVDGFLGSTAAFAEPLAVTLRGAWVCEYSHVQLCAKIRTEIQARQPQASSNTLDLLYYLLVRETLPELLVTDVPEHLQYGRALQSVALIHGTALVEGLRQGCPFALRFDDVIGVSAGLAQSSDAGIHALWARTLAVPALRYATAHGALAGTGVMDIHQASATHISQALAFLTAQQALHATELHALLSIKPPDRKQLAQQMLSDAGLDRSVWDVDLILVGPPILRAHGFTIADGYSMDKLLAAVMGRPQATVTELVMMGEAYIPGQPTVPEHYARAFEDYRQALVAAQGAVISRLLHETSALNRGVLLGSTCEISRVLFDTGQGAQGTFIRCQKGDHRTDFHDHSVDAEFYLEIIPASGVVRRVIPLFDYELVLETGFRGDTVEKHERNPQKLAEARITPLWPLDSDAYLTGAASRRCCGYRHPRNGKLVPSAELIYLAPGSGTPQLDAFAKAAANHQLGDFLESSRQQHNHYTPWENIWAAERRWADVAARLIIPFYGCIKDLAAGEHSAGVIAGCTLDVAFVLIPFGQFAGSTARIVLRAGEMSVLSIIESTGKAVGRLIIGVARQSAVFGVYDLGKAGLKLSRLGWVQLLEQAPELKRLLSSPAALERSLDDGMYLIADSAEHPWQPAREALDKRAMVDGRPSVAVRNIGSPETADFRLLDPEADGVFGPPLTAITDVEPLELSVRSIADRIEPGHYPAILPVAREADGAIAINVAEHCQVRAIERQDGVFDLVIDQQVYHLDTTAPDVALRKLANSRLSSETGLLNEVENLCRLRRDLIPVPCNNGVKLATPAPELIAEGSTSPTRSGEYPSQAMSAREFTLSRVSVEGGATSQAADVFVHEGKFCKWADSPKASGSASAPGKSVVALSKAERVLFMLPDAPVYRTQIEGLLCKDSHFGLPGNYTLEDARWIYEHAPVIELGPVAASVEDARQLRGIRLTLNDADWIFVEADSGVIYKAPVPGDGSLALTFSRVERAEEINEFMRLAEQYRLVRERFGAFIDRDNIARLLFDLRDEAEQAQLRFAWGAENVSYDDYVTWCTARGEENELLKFAGNILAGEAEQQKFVELARNSIADFRTVAERSIPEQQHIVEVLNKLLPIQGASGEWDVLTLDHLARTDTGATILKHIKGANLAFVQASTESGERIVYYALSGGRKAKAVKLRLDMAESTEQIIDGVIYRDARACMASRVPDPAFTSLPVVRNADRLSVREFSRELDSERLIATVLKQDLASTRLSHIRVFTLMDACRSCGGFVLPRLKLDFPQAQFSVTYMKEYMRS